jgi:hypothetical protein
MTPEIERKQQSRNDARNQEETIEQGWSLEFSFPHCSRTECLPASALEVLPDTMEVIIRMTASQMWGDGLAETETWQGGF